tara:strand:- start:983 stop:1270 length:288 start_codon:yes stop_codon:yes gene_type:complete
LKLVRDKIPDIIKKQTGKSCKYYVADETEFKLRLYNKMYEELQEFITKPSAEEAADIFDVLIALIRAHGIEAEDMFNWSDKKSIEKGAFWKRIIL